MGDAGEGLIDLDSRIQEQIDERAREQRAVRSKSPRDPEQLRTIESLRLARTDLGRRLALSTNQAGRAHLEGAIAEVDRRLEALKGDTTAVRL